MSMHLKPAQATVYLRRVYCQC